VVLMLVTVLFPALVAWSAATVVASVTSPLRRS
jgi:hypothetical protein